MDVRLRDVVTHDHGSPMAAGLMSLRRGSFPWTLAYDEIEYVIEGELHIGTPQGTVVGRPGDVLWVPKGAAITFGTPSWAKFLYVTYPAQWAESGTM
jgi:ethanolamine utilization protein EutQ